MNNNLIRIKSFLNVLFSNKKFFVLIICIKEKKVWKWILNLYSSFSYKMIGHPGVPFFPLFFSFYIIWLLKSAFTIFCLWQIHFENNLKKWWYILCIILALSTNQNRHSICWCHYLSGEFTELRLPRVVWDDQQCGEGVSRDAGPRVDWHHNKCTTPAVSGHLGVGQ